MARINRLNLLAAALAICAAGVGHAAKGPVYVMNGYSLSGLYGVKTDELAKKLPHKEGDRVTEADIAADRAIVVKELQAEHIKGHVATTLATKHGHVWVIFDLLDGDHSPVHFGKKNTLASQKFDGASHISADALAAASGLKSGDALWPERILATQRAIVAAYAKALPGKTVTVKAKLQTTADGKATLTWIVVEPK